VETEIEAVTALVHVEQLTPIQLFAPGALNPILERIKAEVRAIETDISTDAGRKAIKSLAYKVARTKTFIDDQRKSLVADEKKRLAAIDAEGGRVWDELEALKEEVRKPLTDWEDAELVRVQEHERRIADMKAVSEVDHFSLANIETARAYLDERWDHNFQEFSKRAIQAREAAELHLAREEASIRKAEQERAETERLRLEAEEKARVEREAKIAEDARLEAEAVAKRREEAQAREAKQREDDLAAAAAEEKARLERERLAAETRLAEAKAQAERDRLAAQERERKAETDRIEAARKAEADRVEAAKQAERDREAAVVAERKRQDDARKAEEDARAKRERDKKHQGEIHREALAALTKFGIEEVVAKTFIELVARKIVPHVSITY
jgi:hypothetical protein